MNTHRPGTRDPYGLDTVSEASSAATVELDDAVLSENLHPSRPPSTYNAVRYLGPTSKCTCSFDWPLTGF